MKTETISHRTAGFLSSQQKREKREARESYIISLSNWCGIAVAASLIGFFLVMRALNLHEILVLRYFNFLFLGGGILAAYLIYRKKYNYKGIKYLTGIKMGMHVCLVGLIPFCIFMGIYLSADTGFMEYIQHHAAFGKFMTPIPAAAAVFMEAFATSSVLTLSLMQLLKDEEFDPNYQK
jgi:hypothetical protein